MGFCNATNTTIFFIAYQKVLQSMAGRQDNSLAKLASKIRYAFDPTAGNSSVLVGVGRIKFHDLVLALQVDSRQVQLVLDVAVASGLVKSTAQKAVYTWNGKECICHHFKKIQVDWIDAALSKFGRMCQSIIAMLLEKDEIPLVDIADAIFEGYYKPLQLSHSTASKQVGDISNILCAFDIIERVYIGSTSSENKSSLRWVFHVNKRSLANCNSDHLDCTKNWCNNCRPTYRLIELNPRSSEDIKNCTGRCIAKEESVFNCDNTTYMDIKDDEVKNSLKKLTNNSSNPTYTDHKRKIIRIKEDDIEEIIKTIEDTLIDQLKKERYKVCNPTLLTTSKGALRQQAHYDFDEKTRESSMFGIVALAEGQTILIFREGGIIDTVQLGINTVFVGFGQCVHAGSETSGKRLHFEFKELGSTDELVQVTFFVGDEHYPMIRR